MDTRCLLNNIFIKCFDGFVILINIQSIILKYYNTFVLNHISDQIFRTMHKETLFYSETIKI